jgi:hypothetical protein
MSDEMIDDTMLEYDYGYPFQCLCGAWDIWDDGMECDICGRIYTPKDENLPNTACSGRLSAVSQQASFIADGDLPSKVSGASARRR